MDDRYAPQPIERWYWVAAVASLLFMLVGFAGYLLDVTTDPNSLPIDQQALIKARPLWMVAAYSIATWTGLAGAVLLLLRRKIAEPVLLVSLVAVMFTFLPYAVVPAMRDIITTNDIAAALVVLAVVWTIYWFARHSRMRGWLR
jgi:hypothetical protein